MSISFDTCVNELPITIGWKDRDSTYLKASPYFTTCLGLKHPDDIIGMKLLETPCDDIIANADEFRRQDVMIMQQQITLQSLHFIHYSNGEKLFLSTKKPLYDDQQQVAGVLGIGQEIINPQLMQLLKSLIAPSQNQAKHKSIFQLQDRYDRYHLSKRQSQCLFLMAQGHSAKMIAAKLELSPRTIEEYIEQIKVKMNCRYKSEILEKAWSEDLFKIIPISILISN